MVALGERVHGEGRDMADVRSFVREGWIDLDELQLMFERIEPQLVRYPALDARSFRRAVMAFVTEEGGIDDQR